LKPAGSASIGRSSINGCCVKTPDAGAAARATAARGAPLRFALTFVIGFAALFGAFEASRGSAFERFVVEDLILKPTVTLIDTVTPGEEAHLESGRVIASPGSHLRVTRGCEGIEMFLLLVAGIIAFPASTRQRAQGLLIGSLLAYALSIARLMSLHYILRYSPGAWEALHGLVLPLGPIIVMALFFMEWSGRVVPPRPAAASRAV
jgi:exosortase/archaeosortase family protein